MNNIARSLGFLFGVTNKVCGDKVIAHGQLLQTQVTEDLGCAESIAMRYLRRFKMLRRNPSAMLKTWIANNSWGLVLLSFHWQVAGEVNTLMLPLWLAVGKK